MMNKNTHISKNISNNLKQLTMWIRVMDFTLLEVACHFFYFINYDLLL